MYYIDGIKNIQMFKNIIWIIGEIPKTSKLKKKWLKKLKKRGLMIVELDEPLGYAGIIRMNTDKIIN